MDGITDIFDNLVEKTEKYKTVDVTDYEVDGLVYCGKCNTAKQTRVTICGKVYMPYCLCKCKKEELDRKEREQREYETKVRIEKNRAKCFHNKELMANRFDKADTEDSKLLISCVRYADNFAQMLADGTGLILHGGVGVGKTYAAACIANAVISSGYTCYMTDFSRILHTLSDFKQDKQLYLDTLNSYDLLVIDDIGAERDTEYANEVVVSVIDSRCKSNKPMIITTNLTADDFFQTEDIRKKRIYSRMLELCIPVECTGRDRRIKKSADRKSKYKDLLCLD
ncbi:MAG: ATP-binding protein [Oscillospiraceae bacterium]|nr:ATP-binding protein [Oscillospiraceae bacterium]